MVQMIENAYEAAATFGKSILLLDRCFLSVPAFENLKQYRDKGGTPMHLVTKAKRSCTAYEFPGPRKLGRGSPHKKWNPVKPKELFSKESSQFITAETTIYGKNEAVSYYYINLLWSQKLYQELRFVLVEYNGLQSILVSTDLELDPLAVIRLYSYRFKAECMFREMKQVIGEFSYQFWSRSVPKLKRHLKKDEKHPIESVSDKEDQKKIVNTIKAIEGYVMLSYLALGMLQLISLTFSGEISKNMRYLRTPSK